MQSALEWRHDPNWEMWSFYVNNKEMYDVWQEHEKWHVYLNKAYSSISVFNTLEEAKHFVEMHYAVGA